MTYNELCNLLAPGDRVVLPIGFGYAHHAIFFGRDVNGVNWFIENQKTCGVQFTTSESIFLSDQVMNVEVEKFNGTDDQRMQAITRATSLIGMQYNILQFNCEQFANYVQYNVSKSPQVRNTLITTAVLSLFAFGRS